MVVLKSVQILRIGKYMYYIRIPKPLMDNDVLLMSRRYNVNITEAESKEVVELIEESKLIEEEIIDKETN